MGAHGATSQGAMLWMLAVLVGVLVAFTLRSGLFFLKGGAPIQRTVQPRLLCAPTLSLSLIAVVSAGAALCIDLRSFPDLPRQ
jgi:formate/nitrite transporter FocA (FNT family)